MPGIRKVNIILSRLCNSSHQGSTTARRVSIFNGQKPAGIVLPAAGIHNLDYVNCAPSVRCERPTTELPGEAADKQPPSGTTRDPARPGAAHFACRKVPGTNTVIKILRPGTRLASQCYAGSPPPYAAPLLGRSLSVSQQAERVRLLAYSVPAPRYGYAVVIPACYSSTPPSG